MPELKALIGRLNSVCKQALENAATCCLNRTHFVVELEHLLIELIDAGESDFARILRAYGIKPDTVRAELERSLDKFEHGNSRTPSLSPQLTRCLTLAWNISSLDLGLTNIRSGAILRAIIETDDLRTLAVVSSPSLRGVPQSRLVEDLPAAMNGGIEDGPATMPDAVDQTRSPKGSSATPALDAYTHDLTEDARAGCIDPIVGRDEEIRQLIDVLMRRRQNNPILTGDAGVGKTAIVEGFAKRVAEGQVPPALASVCVKSLDLGLLQAGAGIRGEFERRLQSVLQEVSASLSPIILFIDEAHTLIGAGAQQGQGDAANLLKPALARGVLRTIAATTWSEYKHYFEKDPALARRFQVIKVAEPSEAVAADMLRAVAGKLEAHHGVRILDEAIVESVRLSHRYITGRYLPDKAVSVLDTACARVAIAQADTPPALQDACKRVTTLSTEMGRLSGEAKTGVDHEERLGNLELEAAGAEDRKLQFEARWRLERETVLKICAVERELAAATNSKALPLEQTHATLRLELQSIQDAERLVPVAVDNRVVAEVISGWTGIPVGRMLSDSLGNARTLKERMAARIIGQDAALDTICRRIQTYYAQLGEPNKPTGVFLLVGPSGVGKTETALTLSDMLFGGPQALVTINMSEYQESHSVSGLRGAPPGYVGYGKGGILTEAIRRRPYSVLLLDEVEKAHEDVVEMFYQVFDKGILEDSDGQVVDFSNAVIMLTSNVGSEVIADVLRSHHDKDSETLAGLLRPVLLKRFPAAFLARLVVVPYRSLSDSDIQQIVRLKLSRLQERFALNYNGELTYDTSVVSMLVDRARENESGARTVDAILNHTVLPNLSAELLKSIAEGEAFDAVHMGIGSQRELNFRFS